MDTEGIIGLRIEPRLVSTLGLEMANSVLTRATIGYVTTEGSDRKRYEVFVHSICSDDARAA